MKPAKRWFVIWANVERTRWVAVDVCSEHTIDAQMRHWSKYMECPVERREIAAPGAT